MVQGCVQWKECGGRAGPKTRKGPDELQWTLTEGIYASAEWIKERTASANSRGWILKRMRLARSPLVTHEYALRTMLDFFAIRRLYTATGPYSD